MNIKGIEKTTLLDYPGHISTTIFTGGCNFRCPYCHNGDLVLQEYMIQDISENEVFAHLDKRKHIIDGVCITGGEPTLQSDLLRFLHKIKSFDLKVKLDTNGTNPSILRTAFAQGLVDYIAMDIKNTKEKYSLTSAFSKLNLDDIQESIDFITTCGVDYEFRTTILEDFHTEDDIIQIGEWLKGSKLYILQPYIESHKQIQKGLHGYSHDNIKKFAYMLEPYFDHVGVRGI